MPSTTAPDNRGTPRDRLAEKKAELVKATTACKLAAAKRSRIAAEAATLKAAKTAEEFRLQSLRDRARGAEAEAALIAEREAWELERQERAAEAEAHQAERARLLVELENARAESDRLADQVEDTLERQIQRERKREIATAGTWWAQQRPKRLADDAPPPPQATPRLSMAPLPPPEINRPNVPRKFGGDRAATSDPPSAVSPPNPPSPLANHMALEKS